jgi:glycosyltransferase involved in cell wall biosynthesis
MRKVLAADGVDCEVIEHWCDAFPARPATARAGDSVLRVQYAGHVGHACDLEAFARALRDLPQRDRFRFRFHAFGIKMPALRALALCYPEVEIGPWLPFDAVGAALAESDVQLILTPPEQLGYVYASKLYVAMAAGVPVVASLPRRSVMHRFIAETGVGISVAAEEEGALAAALDRMSALRRDDPDAFRAMGEHGRAFTERWNGAVAADRYAAALFGNEQECPVPRLSWSDGLTVTAAAGSQRGR